MKCYHKTFHPEEILRDGFKDATGLYLTADLHAGVWLSDEPLDYNEGAKGDVLLSIEIPDEIFAEYEWGAEDEVLDHDNGE
jgi:hypothetical protein